MRTRIGPRGAVPCLALVALALPASAGPAIVVLRAGRDNAGLVRIIVGATGD